MLRDVLVVGGSYAGMAAATLLARARRTVTVVDAGLARNRFSSHAHNIVGHDGRPGSEIIADAHAQFARYPSGELKQGAVAAIERTADGFAATLNGETIEAKRVILATGVADILPPIIGAEERWGATVLHCPYCHGFEIGGGRIGVLGLTEHSAHYAALIADWGEPVLITERELAPDAEALLKRRNVEIVRGRVASIEGAAPTISALRLTDGRAVEVKALFVGSATLQASPLAEALGCAIDETPMGPVVRTTDTKQTTVPGVYAAGDAARVPHSVTFAMFDGMNAGFGVHRDLIGL